MRARWFVLMAGLWCGCSYSHIAQQSASYRQVSATEWVLRVERQMDTVLRGPETEELQVLTVRLRDPQVNRRYVVPSPDAEVALEIRRFGLSSRGQDYRGQIVLRNVTHRQMTADLRLVIQANTATGLHPQTVKFRGRHVFWRSEAP